MTVLINNASVESVTQLPDNIQTIIQLTARGDSWINAIIANTDITQQFDSFEQFIEQLVYGLHGTTLVYVKHLDVFISVEKLLDMGTNDLRDLYNQAQMLESMAGQPLPTPVVSLLNKYNLVDNKTLNKVLDEFALLANLPSDSLLRGASFEQQLILAQMLCYCDAHLNFAVEDISQAANWAMNEAKNLGEFAYYYGLYALWFTQVNQASDQGDKSSLSIEQLASDLGDVVEQNMISPVSPHPLDQIGLQQFIAQWSEQGIALGFTDFASGLFNLAMNVQLSSEDVADLAKSYVENRQQQLLHTLAMDANVTQAGTRLLYDYTIDGSYLRLSMDDNGTLSIYADAKHHFNLSETFPLSSFSKPRQKAQDTTIYSIYCDGDAGQNTIWLNGIAEDCSITLVEEPYGAGHTANLGSLWAIEVIDSKTNEVAIKCADAATDLWLGFDTNNLAILQNSPQTLLLEKSDSSQATQAFYLRTPSGLYFNGWTGDGTVHLVVGPPTSALSGTNWKIAQWVSAIQ